MSDRVRVVYIMGSARSGSTVLDTILGAHPRACGVGELAGLEVAAWQNAEYCSCGELGSECPFWTDVRQRWESNGGDIDRYRSLKARFERIRSQPRFLLARRMRTAAFREWSRLTAELFRALRDVSGADVIVDSSKGSGRALALSSVPELDVFLVHLVRDGRGVAWSLAKSFQKDVRAGVQHELPPRSVSRTAVFWTLVNVLCERVRRGVPADRQTLIRYEDYAQDLAGALGPLADFVGEDLLQLAQEAASGATLPTGHKIAGNRLRMRGSVKLQPDVEWQSAMPASERQRFWRIAGTTLRRFGYAK